MRPKHRSVEHPTISLFGAMTRFLCERFWKTLVVFLFVNLAFGGIATHYIIQFWVSYFKGVPIHVPFVPCVIAGLFLGEITIPAAMFTWLCSLFL